MAGPGSPVPQVAPCRDEPFHVGEFVGGLSEQERPAPPGDGARVRVPPLEVAGRATGVLADVRDFLFRPGGVPGFGGPGDLADQDLAHVGADPAAAERLDDRALGGQHQKHR